MKALQKGKVTASAWMDNKVVSVLSTNTQPSAKTAIAYPFLVQRPSLCTTLTWEVLTGEICYVATTTAGQRVESFIVLSVGCQLY